MTMTQTFEERLNQILPRITSEDFLQNRGLGNEIGFWIFEYPPEQEMAVRSFLSEVVEPALRRRQPPLRYVCVNLLELVVDVLEHRKLFDKVIKMQAEKGDDAVFASLQGVLNQEKLAQRIVGLHNPDELDMMIFTGVGAAYPLVRSHTLLNALHPLMKNTPLLMFFPGRYDGYSLRLFNKLTDKHYYRAFRLVP
ncbi:DUF1788 domain-containing protein [Thauera aminoaromatica]|jgi:hypothetical protein|uniref:DUF1788 domain-containing protein n=1 Tax=Thauera aminoaromatica TaxID=164330 RepID=C4ZMN9_THASP|nr:DUF1788 domain-containing protein [Thauera aminoaromatica]ACK53083.1 Domain of unknown function DUF1788 [Thauera aminoaromatica]